MVVRLQPQLPSNTLFRKVCHFGHRAVFIYVALVKVQRRNPHSEPLRPFYTHKAYRAITLRNLKINQCLVNSCIRLIPGSALICQPIFNLRMLISMFRCDTTEVENGL